jgi:hypothetical protein
MRIYPMVLALSLACCGLANAAPAENSAIDDPEEVANPPQSWVCLNPQTRRYEALKAVSLQGAQQAVGGDDSTTCKQVPAALDPEGMAQQLNSGS